MSEDLTRDRVIAALGDLYEVETELGRGGMAIVYRAKDMRLRRRVAIKVLPPELAFNPQVKTRFLREAETSAQLSHQNIVPIYSVDERDGVVYFVMGLVDGETLGEMLQRAPRPPVDVVRRVLAEVADALQYAHARGVVHRDIKPDNILIERDGGRALVTDFGIARAAEAESRLTVTGVTVGTPAYMSPEQALGESELDGRSDLYSLGIVGYEMLAGEIPFRASNTPAMMMKHVGEAPRPVRERRLDCPPALSRAIDVALAKKPEERWKDAAALKAALTDERAVAPPSAAPSPAPLGRPAPYAPMVNPVPQYPRSAGSEPEARRNWHEAEREWRGQVQQQKADWRDIRDSRMDARESRRAGHLERFRAMPIDERVRAFRRDAVTGAGSVAFLTAINIVFAPFFPWAIFPAVGLVRRLMGKWETMEGEDITLRDALSPRWRDRLRAKGKMMPALGASKSPGGLASAAAAGAADASNLVARDVLEGPYGGAVRRAADDRAVILDTLRKLSEVDLGQIPDVAPTAASLLERIAELATSLHRMEGDVAPEAVSRLEARITAAQQETGEAKERERKLSLLERQKATVAALRERREVLLTQIESASLVLQNLRLDLLKLRSAGIDAAAMDLNSATQEARALSRDIGHVLDAAAEVRKL